MRLPPPPEAPAKRSAAPEGGLCGKPLARRSRATAAGVRAEEARVPQPTERIYKEEIMNLQSQTVKFGDLLVKLQLVSEKDVNDALQVAPQFGMPLGRTLVLSGRLTEAELQLAVELQPLINKKAYPL